MKLTDEQAQAVIDMAERGFVEARNIIEPRDEVDLEDDDERHAVEVTCLKFLRLMGREP